MFINYTSEYFYGKEKYCNREGVLSWYDHFMMGAKGNVLTTYLYEALCEYYKKENASIEYGILGCFAVRAYKNIPAVRTVIDSIPVNNPQKFYLQFHYSDKYDPAVIEKIKEETKYFKLNWRLPHIEDPESIYQHILKHQI